MALRLPPATTSASASANPLPTALPSQTKPLLLLHRGTTKAAITRWSLLDLWPASRRRQRSPRITALLVLLPRSGFEGLSCTCSSSLHTNFLPRSLLLTRITSSQIPTQSSLILPCRLRTRHHPAILPPLKDPLRHRRLPRGALRTHRVHRQHLQRSHPETAYMQLPSRVSREPMQTHCVVSEVYPPGPRCPCLPARPAQHRAPGHLCHCARSCRRVWRRLRKGQESQRSRR